ncbi:cingulin-like [Hydra vulgaris]|uniref:cingulin-like n=1 Tax=Hydra vulgaris TaxID=6087 RepID=UPI0032E9FD00
MLNSRIKYRKPVVIASSVPTSNLPLIYTSKAYATQDRNPLNSSIAIRKSGDGYINVESEYIQNLLQQVHLLELEVFYLKDKYHKRQIPLNLVLESEKLAEKVKASEYELSIREQEINSKENAIALLHQEQQEFKSKIELLTESFNVEKKELVNEIVSLKKQVERYELDQARQNSQIEKLKFDFDSCMLSLSGSKSQVQVLQNRLEEKTNDFNAMRVAFEEKLAESLKVQTELKQLEDKYFYSRERSKEQVDSVLKNELKELRFSFREKEIQADQDRTLRIKISEDCGNLIKENAALSSQIIELKKQLEIESELKEDVHYRKQSTIQELVTLKEEVKQKDRELERLREQLSSQHERMANAMKNVIFFIKIKVEELVDFEVVDLVDKKTMFKKNSSEVRNHFKKDESCEKAIYKYCSTNIGCKGSSTSGLICHLSAVHPEKAIKRKESEANLEAGPETSKISKIKTQPTIFNYVKRQSMAEIIARLCALDGFSISGFAKVCFIRDSLSARGFQLLRAKPTL